LEELRTPVCYSVMGEGPVRGAIRLHALGGAYVSSITGGRMAGKSVKAKSRKRGKRKRWTSVKCPLKKMDEAFCGGG